MCEWVVGGDVFRRQRRRERQAADVPPQSTRTHAPLLHHHPQLQRGLDAPEPVLPQPRLLGKLLRRAEVRAEAHGRQRVEVLVEPGGERVPPLLGCGSALWVGAWVSGVGLMVDV